MAKREAMDVAVGDVLQHISSGVRYLVHRDQGDGTVAAWRMELVRRPFGPLCSILRVCIPDAFKRVAEGVHAEGCDLDDDCSCHMRDYV